MSLFKKYNDNKAGFTVSGSVLPRNTLFNDTGLIQSVSRPDVVAGRAESSLFRKRQETDEKRIEKFINSPAGRNHLSKEIGFSRSNPVFSLNGGIGDNPSRIINPRKVITNSGLAGSGTFNDKFGIINISQDDGYSKYFKEDKSKLTELYDKFSLKINTNQTSQVSSPTPFERFSTEVNNVSRFLGFRVPPAVLYEYAGGPGSNNGIGLTTIYKYENLPDKEFYTIKPSLGIFDQNGNSLKRRDDTFNYEENKFWNKTNTTITEGNLEKDKELSRFINFFGNIVSQEYGTYNANFKSQFTSSFGFNRIITNQQPRSDSTRTIPISSPTSTKRFISSGSRLTNEYKSGSLKPGISDYYVTKQSRVTSYSLRTTGSLNAFYDSGSYEKDKEFSNLPGNSGQASVAPYPDLIDFKLEIIDLDITSGNQSYYLYFKAFIDSFTDDFKANYDTIAYPGNPSGKIYKYQSFDRNIGLTFKVAIFSESEFDQIYKKLNRLASTTLPTITDEAVRSTITKLTVGNWCKRLPGVVSGITFQNLVENPWDIDKGAPQILTINLSYLYSSTYENTTKTFVSSSSGIGTTLFGPDATQ
jgi:hypothetical protein